MALPVGGSADSNLPAKGLTAEEIANGPDQEDLQEDSDGEINDGEDEDEGVYFVQLGEEILHMQKRKARDQMEAAANKRASPPALVAVV